MVRMNRSIIAKAVFSISVVAVTATVGVVGFAQAAHHNNAGPGRGAVLAAATNGYGGIGEQVRAAVEAFQAAIAAASDKFQSDVQACVADFRGNPAAGATTFDSSAEAAVSDFSAQTANPTSFPTVDKFDANVGKAGDKLDKRLNDDSSRFTSRLDRLNHSQQRRNDYRKCIQKAQRTFRDSVQDARRDLRQALRNIFHH